MSDKQEKTAMISRLDIPLERDVFLRALIRELAGTLEDVVGLEQASGFISVVGQRIGEQIDGYYRAALGVQHLNRDQVSDIFTDLKRRIKGGFYIIEESDEKVVLGNNSCPFEDKVFGRKSMCMMTSNVFGIIAAENLGYAKLCLQETIAAGDPECRVEVFLQPGPEADACEGREYFGSTEPDDSK